MISHRGRRIAIAVASLAGLSLALAAILSWRSLSEAWWLRRLQSEEEPARIEALARLGAMKSRKAIPELVKAAEDKDPEVRKALVDASAAIGIEAIPVLERLLATIPEEVGWTSYAGATSGSMPVRIEDAVGEALLGLGSAEEVSRAIADQKLRFCFANALESKGRLEEALAELLRIYDEKNPSIFDMKHMVTWRIQALAQSHPPARAALRDRRDRLGEKIIDEASRTNWLKRALSGTRVLAECRHLIQLDEILEEPAHVLEVFTRARGLSGGATVREHLLEQVIDGLLDERRHEEVVEAGGQLLQQIQGTLNSLPMMRATVNPQPAPGEQDFILEIGLDQARTAAKLYQAHLGAGKGETADIIARKLLAALPPVEVYPILIRRAREAGDEDRAKALLDRARAELSAADRKRMEELLAGPVEPEKNASRRTITPRIPPPPPPAPVPVPVPAPAPGPVPEEP